MQAVVASPYINNKPGSKHKQFKEPHVAWINVVVNTPLWSWLSLRAVMIELSTEHNGDGLLLQI